MVEDRKLDYIHSKRLDKPLVALSIIREWRAQDPPGRFLKIEDKTGLWNDVGDKKAREKTSQALREKAPTLRKQEEDDKQKDSEDDEEAEDEVSVELNGNDGMESVFAAVSLTHSLSCSANIYSLKKR